MAITNFSELQSQIQSWLMNRTDLATQAPDFITLCEADLNTRPDFRVKEMESSSDLTQSTGVCTLPTDYLEYRSVVAKTDPRHFLDLVARDFVDDNYGDNAAGTPTYFIIEGASMRIYERSTDTIEIRYYAKVPALSTSATTNWLLTKSPNTYLYGSLRHAAIFMRDMEGVGLYDGLYNASIEALINADKGARWARGAVRQRDFRP